MLIDVNMNINAIASNMKTITAIYANTSANTDTNIHINAHTNIITNASTYITLILIVHDSTIVPTLIEDYL